MKLHTFRWSGLVGLAMLSACGDGDGGTFPGTLQLAATSYDATEGTVVNIRVARSGGSDGIATVDYVTVDGDAVGGSDYTPSSGTLTWQDGLSGNQTVSITVTDDSIDEPSEAFTLNLTNVTGATLGGSAAATVNIIDND